MASDSELLRFAADAHAPQAHMAQSRTSVLAAPDIVKSPSDDSWGFVVTCFLGVVVVLLIIAIVYITLELNSVKSQLANTGIEQELVSHGHAGRGQWRPPNISRQQPMPDRRVEHHHDARPPPTARSAEPTQDDIERALNAIVSDKHAPRAVSSGGAGTSQGLAESRSQEISGASLESESSASTSKLPSARDAARMTINSMKAAGARLGDASRVEATPGEHDGE